MSTSIGILNYFAFFILYIICFVFFYNKFSEIVGFSILIVIHFAFMLYSINDVMKIFKDSYFFVQMMACFSIIIGLTLHTVVLIFILMVINNMQVKYTKKYGTPLNIPNKYKDKMELIKRLMIASFCLGIVILYIIFYYNNDLNHNFATILRYFNVIDLIKYKTLFFTLSASLVLMGISSYQVYIGNTFTQLSRQQLMDKPK